MSSRAPRSGERDLTTGKGIRAVDGTGAARNVFSMPVLIDALRKVPPSANALIGMTSREELCRKEVQVPRIADALGLLAPE